MPTPTYSLRVAPEHRALVKRVADLAAAGRAEEVRRLLDDLDAEPVGPYRSLEAFLDDLVWRLVVQLQPEEVWLFGSRARGDHRPDSDVDLIAVLPDGLAPERYAYRAANAFLRGGGGPTVQVFPIARSAFEGDPDALGGMGALVRTARAEGRRLYRDGRLDRGRAA